MANTLYADQSGPRTAPMGKIPPPEPGTNPIVRHIEDGILFLMELQRRADEKAKMKTLPWHLINDAGISSEELEADLKRPFWRFPCH